MFRLAFTGAFLLSFLFCTPPAYYRQKQSQSGPLTNGFIFEKGYLKDGDGQHSTSSEIVRVKIHQGGAIAAKAPSWQFRTQGSLKSGSGEFTVTTAGTFIPNERIFALKGKTYAGSLEIRRQGRGYVYINLVSLDDYLVSVAGHEMSPSWPVEALKAQVVVARTYLFQRIKEGNGRLWHVDATTNHQVYGGVVKGDGNLQKAVSSTRGQVVRFGGGLAQVFFHSSCGGHTASAKEVWGGDFAYLRAKTSRYCALAPVYRWKQTISLAEIGRRLGLGKVKSIRVKNRTPSKRAKTLIVTTTRGQRVVSANDFRMKLGASRVKSTYFGIKVSGRNAVIAGRGYGHGVGMCQWGAKFMADIHHYDYRQIIRHYFPGTELGSTSLASVS